MSRSGNASGPGAVHDRKRRCALVPTPRHLPPAVGMKGFDGVFVLKCCQNQRHLVSIRVGVTEIQDLLRLAWRDFALVLLVVCLGQLRQELERVSVNGVAMGRVIREVLMSNEQRYMSIATACSGGNHLTFVYPFFSNLFMRRSPRPLASLRDNLVATVLTLALLFALNLSMLF